MRILDLINPIGHALTREAAERYRVEPYVLAADVGSVPPHVGQGGWSWYTGAAAWAWRLGIEGILGIRRVEGGVRIDPCIPTSWGHAQVRIRGPAGTLVISIEDPDGVGTGVVEIEGKRTGDALVRFPRGRRRAQGRRASRSSEWGEMSAGWRLAMWRHAGALRPIRYFHPLGSRSSERPSGEGRGPTHGSPSSSRGRRRRTQANGSGSIEQIERAEPMVKQSRTRSTQVLERSEPIEPRSRPIQERSKQTVNRILEAAAELVDDVGVIAFNTNLLAERADIRVRTIYRYFPSKLGILSALMTHLNDESAQRLKWLSELGDPDSDWRELVGRWIDEVLKWTHERPGARLLMGWSQNIPELEALADQIDEEWVQTMMKAMRARGVDLPTGQLYAVCCNFTETLDAMTSHAASYPRKRSNEIIEETRCMLDCYLALYLD